VRAYRHTSDQLARRALRTATPRLIVAAVIMSGLTFVSSLNHAGAVTIPAFANESGQKIMSAAMTAARVQGSFTSSSATTISGQAYAEVTNSSATTGQQSLSLGNAKSVVRVVGGVVYIDDDAAAIQAQFGVSAPNDANKWIAIPSTNSNFVRFNSGILLASTLSEVTPGGTLRTTKTSTLQHKLVVGVTGKPNIHLGLASGTETVYVAATLPHVPVELVATDAVQGQQETFVITFTNWGKNFHVTKPAASIPISTTKLPN
jgi:hypothetical protein